MQNKQFKNQRILITGDGGTLNNGVMAMVTSTVQSIRNKNPNIEISILSNHPFEDFKRLKFLNVSVFEPEWSSRITSTLENKKKKVLHLSTTILTAIIFSIIYRILNINRFPGRIRSLRWFTQADLIVDLSGDSITEDYTKISYFFIVFSIILPILMGKPVFVCAQSIGPFKSLLLKILTRHTLNRTLISIREEFSFIYMKKIKINKNKLVRTADTAFLLKPSADEKINEIMSRHSIYPHYKWIGVSVSNIMQKFVNSTDVENKNTFFETMASVLDDFLKRHENFRLLFIPHVQKSGNNDIKASYLVITNMQLAKRTRILDRPYTAAEMKGVIGKLDLFLGCRMHALIAATSMKIPSVGISYSWKTWGIIGKQLKQEKFIVDCKTPELKNKIIEKLKLLFDTHNQVKSNLALRINLLEKESFKNFKIINYLLNRSINSVENKD